MNKFFDHVAPVYERLHGGAEKTFGRISVLAGFKLTDRVLDIGGGTGRISQFLVGKVSEIIVLDPSEKMIAECKKHTGLTCEVGSGEQIPLADESVDKVIMVDAFHHVGDQEKVLSEIRRVLKPDGLVVFEEFAPERLGGKLVLFFEKIFKLGSIFHSPKKLERLFENAGFAVRLLDQNRREYYLLARKTESQ